MKRIGIIGGLSAESTTHFYSALTREYTERFNRPDYPEIVLFSVRFQTLMDWVNAGEWDKFTDTIVDGMIALEAAGADFAVISANLPHVVFDQVEQRTSLPLLHIADTVAAEAQLRGFRRVALMGTLATMKAAFYPERLGALGMECMVPTPDQQNEIQEMLDAELFRGIVTEASEKKFITIIEALKEKGAEAVILGCTEIPMLITEANSPIPVLDSTQLFVLKTLDFALGEGSK